jgi:cytochrome b subunit of formate dehydrogenase
MCVCVYVCMCVCVYVIVIVIVFAFVFVFHLSTPNIRNSQSMNNVTLITVNILQQRNVPEAFEYNFPINNFLIYSIASS